MMIVFLAPFNLRHRRITVLDCNISKSSFIYSLDMGDSFLYSTDTLSVFYENNVVNLTKATSSVQVLSFCGFPGAHLYGDLLVNDNIFFHDETSSAGHAGILSHMGILNFTISNNLFRTYATESARATMFLAVNPEWTCVAPDK